MAAKVSDWMRRDVRTVVADLPLSQLEDCFVRDRVSGYPVTSPDNTLLGLVSRSDVIRQLSVEHTWAETLSDYHRDWSDTESLGPSLEDVGELAGRRLSTLCIEDVMVREVITVAPDDSLTDAARVLVEHRIHRVPVVDAKRLVGILTTLDVARFVAEQDG